MGKRKIIVSLLGTFLIAIWIYLCIRYYDVLIEEKMSKIFLITLTGIGVIATILMIVVNLLEQQRDLMPRRKYKKSFLAKLYGGIKNLIHILVVVGAFSLIVIITFFSPLTASSATSFAQTILVFFPIILLSCLLIITKQYYVTNLKRGQINGIRSSLRENLADELDIELQNGKLNQSITDYLNSLIRILSIGIFRDLQKKINSNLGPKVAYVLLPHKKSGKFRIVHHSDCNTEVYSSIFKENAPPLYFKEQFQKLLDRWDSLDKKHKVEKEKEFESIKNKIASSIGYIFYHDIDNEILNNVYKCKVYNADYERLISSDKRPFYIARSMYPIPLKIKGIKLGMLVVTDTARYGFYISDLDTIKIFSYHVAKIIYKNLKKGHYSDIVTLQDLEREDFECPPEVAGEIKSF